MAAARARVSDLRVLAVNRAFEWVPAADALYACDAKWWRAYRAAWEFPGQKWTMEAVPELANRLFRVDGIDRPGLSETPGLLHTGRNGGYQALNLAVQFGAARIVLLGFDMKPAAGGALHCHPDHGPALGNPSPQDLARWTGAFATVAPDMERLGVLIVNASRETALTCFPRVALEEVLPWT